MASSAFPTLRRTRCSGCGQLFEHIDRTSEKSGRGFQNSPAFCSPECEAKHRAGQEEARFDNVPGPRSNRIAALYLKRAGLK